MRIASWNINSIRTRLAHLLDWLRETQPDVVLLQETKTQDQTFPFEPLEELNYNIATYGQKSYNGVAILSKHPIEDIQKGLPGFEDPQARYIEAVVYGKRVASVYVPNGQSVGSDKFIYKLHFMEALHQHVRTLLTYGESCVVAGDYNITPHDEDVYDPAGWREEVLCSTPERQALHRLFHLGYADAHRLLYPQEVMYSWWDYRQGSYQKNNGLRIDLALMSPLAQDQLTQAGIDTYVRALAQPSDHAPIWVELGHG